jgi:mannose-6-phosphate isomerase-like protein (cupin superfamily)
MLRRSEEMLNELKEQMRGGKGTVELTHIFKQGEIKGKARLCAKITINPGCSIGLHQHVEEEEIFYFIKGVGQVDDNGVKSGIRAGDALLTGGGASHSVENTGSEPLEMVAIILLY